MRTCIAIDLKSFYAAVECVDRGLDPLKANLVVADASRTDKTICLAVSPALKSLGISAVKHEFNLIGMVKDYLGITDETVLRGESHPVDTSRQLTGAVSLNGHIEAPLMEGINQGLVSIERRLTAGKDDHERV